MQFGTPGVDNDLWVDGNCATDWGGNAGNWYNDCVFMNLNGEYSKVATESWKYMYWSTFDNTAMALRKMRWMVREVV